jgi:phage-related protein
MKPLHWIGSSLRDVKQFPDDVRSEVGFALYMAQQGDRAMNVVPLLGFGGARVLETVIDSDKSTYRAVYTVKFANAIYVLHAFQKKSVRGIATPKPDMDLIRTRLKVAEEHHTEAYKTRVKERSHERRGA